MNGRWRYQALRETLYIPDHGWQSTYGLQASRETAHGWEQLEWLHDVTTRRDFAEALAALLNRCQLSPVHLRDVIEDLLP